MNSVELNTLGGIYWLPLRKRFWDETVESPGPGQLCSLHLLRDLRSANQSQGRGGLNGGKLVSFSMDPPWLRLDGLGHCCNMVLFF